MTSRIQRYMPARSLPYGLPGSHVRSAKLVLQQKRCLVERSDGRFGRCRFSGRESGTKTLQRTIGSQSQLCHLYPFVNRLGFGVRATGSSGSSRLAITSWIVGGRRRTRSDSSA